MASRGSRRFFGFSALGVCLLVPLLGMAQAGGPVGRPGGVGGPGFTTSVSIYVRDGSGSPVFMAIVTVRQIIGGVSQQARTQSGRAQFTGLAPGDYDVEVVAPGFKPVNQTLAVRTLGTIADIIMKPDAGESPPNTPGPPVLTPKAQKLLKQAREALRASKPKEARPSLDEAYRLAPGHPEVLHLFGVYDAEMGDWTGAKTYWEKAIGIYPNHVGSLISLSETLLTQGKTDEALPYATRALELEPAAWRPHFLMAQASLNQGRYDDAIKESDRALELGHSQAVMVRPVLARALVARGNKGRAIKVLEDYLHDRPADAAAQKMLDNLRAPAAPPASSGPA